MGIQGCEISTSGLRDIINSKSVSNIKIKLSKFHVEKKIADQETQ